jgi:hypothetical protein
VKRIGLIDSKRISPACFEVTYINDQGAGSQAAQAFFIANAPCQVIWASESHTVAETGAPSLAIDIVKEASGSAAGTSTTSVLASTFNGKGTANTPQKVLGNSTVANVRLAAGDRLSFKPSASGSQLTGVIIAVGLKYI